jgi:hypothetical protein
VNKIWHAANRMPPKATRAERIRWHVTHARACACREVPASLREEVAARLKRRKRTKPAKP